MALKLQPAGYGFYALLQSFVGLMSLIAGMGIATALVRDGADPIARGHDHFIHGLRKAAWILFWWLSTIAALLLFLARKQLSSWVFGTADHASTVTLMVIAILFTIASQIQAGTLNAYHAVAALAKCSVASTVLTSCLSIACVLIWSVEGIVPAIIGAAIVGWLVSAYFLRREIGPSRSPSQSRGVHLQVWSLLRFGGPYTVSMLAGTGVQFAMPIAVLHLLNSESVAYYKAATAVSVGYLGFLSTAMGQDYYPRVSAAKNDAATLVELINEQQRLVMLFAVPIILGTLALVPYVVPLVYSSLFIPTVEILEWQLIGDLFKFSSWTMSWVILARCRSSVYFLTELTSGAASLSTLYVGVYWFGLQGVGISFLFSYIIYYFIVWFFLRRQICLVWTASNKLMILGALVAMLIIRVLPSTVFSQARTPVALLLATAATLWSIRVVWRDMWSPKEQSSL